MARGRQSARPERLVTAALLLRRVPLREADLMVTLFTEAAGKVSAVARSARGSSRRFAGLEPLHRLRVTLDRRPGAEVWSLVESSIDRPRIGVTATLERMEAAGKALSWLRTGAGAMAEPELWRETEELLDVMETSSDVASGGASLVGYGLRLLAGLGWGLELGRCVSCDKVCRPDESARLDPIRGGLICRACGGGPRLLTASLRFALLAARDGDYVAARDALDVAVACEIIDEALAGHAR